MIAKFQQAISPDYRPNYEKRYSPLFHVTYRIANNETNVLSIS